jgi:hypothetical protein
MQKEQAAMSADEAEGGNREQQHTSREFLKKRGFQNMDESLRTEN